MKRSLEEMRQLDVRQELLGNYRARFGTCSV